MRRMVNLPGHLRRRVTSGNPDHSLARWLVQSAMHRRVQPELKWSHERTERETCDEVFSRSRPWSVSASAHIRITPITAWGGKASYSTL